ncbi:MAG: RlmE family RNA methyltransferase [Bacteroidia bacterium]|nr:RlmE family RNA methyltransferase [Bacteroidia bacterium]MCZ2277640.1 RlmE family RNA methyltransferase [Bacteroidia bacterium]
MAYQPNDYYSKKAKSENFAARSVYKLEEINNRYRLIHKGDHVLDLGASPGSWSQYVSKLIGIKGKIFGIDLKKVEINLENTVFIQGDIEAFDFEEAFRIHGFTLPFDVVISDMAPDTTSNRFTDQVRSFNLCTLALEVAIRYLKPGGNFVSKIFDGPDAMKFGQELRQYFSTVHPVRPKSIRKSSKEFFFVATGFKKAS